MTLREHVSEALEHCDRSKHRRTPWPGDWVRHISDPNTFGLAISTLGLAISKVKLVVLVLWSTAPGDPGYSADAGHSQHLP